MSNANEQKKKRKNIKTVISLAYYSETLVYITNTKWSVQFTKLSLIIYLRNKEFKNLKYKKFEN